MNNIAKIIYKNRAFFITTILLVIALLIADDTFARLGGAGGSSSSGGDGGDGLFSILYLIFMLLPFPLNFIVAGVIIFGYLYMQKKGKQKSVFNKISTQQKPTAGKVPSGFYNFNASNPTFDEAKFKEKVKTAFNDLQYAWQDKDMSKVRKFISDGMYQRLNTQFKMMNILSQKNTIEKLKIRNVFIDKVETDGLYDIIHVGIDASLTDRFISDKYKSLNSGGSEQFVEYWSFLRKRGVEEKDMYTMHNCPSCGGDLPTDVSEISKCKYCGAITNSGEFDWVLSEITQADDYVNISPQIKKLGDLTASIANLVEDNNDFAVQLIEDKASNGYLQIQTARVLKDTKLMRRFVSDTAFDKLSSIIEKEEKFVFNRLYLNDVSLIGAMQKDEKNVLMIAIKSSYQRVVLNGKKANLIDYAVRTKTEFVLLSRDIMSKESKGSLYSHSCPSCGGPVGDTLIMNCEYCGDVINSTSTEWIISDLMDIQEYNKFYSDNARNFIVKVNPEKLDSLYKVRDYAFNNVLIMVAADGVFDTEELEFTKKLAKKWGYNLKKIEPMFQMAQNGKLVVRMPENAKSRRKIYKMMEKASKIDGNISVEEQRLLDSVKAEYL